MSRSATDIVVISNSESVHNGYEASENNVDNIDNNNNNNNNDNNSNNIVVMRHKYEEPLSHRREEEHEYYEEEQPQQEQHVNYRSHQEQLQPHVVSTYSFNQCTREPFFSFSTSGKRFTWWSIVILVTLALCTVGSIIVFTVKSIQRNTSSPPQLLRDLNEVYCPWASTHVEPIAFTAWSNKSGRCNAVRYGHVRPCSSYIDCLLVGTSCASSEVLANLRCEEVYTTRSADESTSHFEEFGNMLTTDKVCTLNITPEAREQAAMSGSFCTTQHTQCALCTGDGCYGKVISCIASSECNKQHTSEISEKENIVKQDKTWTCMRYMPERINSEQGIAYL